MSDSSVLVSVVTPCLDPGPRLERCIESIRAQTYPHVEHIVMDGGSTDGTVAFLEQTTGIEWVSEPDTGQAQAINKGFRRARGAMLGWLNADDVLLPNAIERVVGAFQSDNSIGWVVGDIEIVEGTDREVRRPARIDKPMTWAARNVAGQPGSFVARWALDRVGLLDESLHYMLDCDLFLRLIDEGIAHHYIPETLARFEIHADSKSGSVSHAEFAWEEGIARLKSGRVRTAAVAFGRAAAWRAWESGSGIDHALRAAREALGDEARLLPPSLMRAGADTELALLASKNRGLAGVSRLLNPRIWRYPETRSRLRHAGGRQLRRMKRTRTTKLTRSTSTS